MKATTLLLVLAVTTIADSKRYRSDYMDYPDAGGWLKLQRVPANWHEARLRCHLEDSDVASVTVTFRELELPCSSDSSTSFISWKLVLSSSMGGTLASPLTGQMAGVMKSIIADSELGCGIFTGIHATISRGDFSSVEGVPLARIPHRWAPGEPDNENDCEQCVALLPGGTLADVRCNDTFPYICYRKYTGQILNACGTFDNEYQLDSRTGSCYKFHQVPRTWSRAHMACAAEGGHLAVINSGAEAAVLKELFEKNPASKLQSRSPFGKDIIYVGFYDWNEHGEWLTVQGETLEQAGYARWSGGQPDNMTHGEHRGEFCGGIFRSGQLDDLWCGMPYHFICEKTPDSLLGDDQ